MLKIYHANKLEALLPHLARQLVDVPECPFQPEVILVQNPGMAQWLKLQIANMFGVAANIEFPLPSSFIWRVFRQVWPELPEQSAFIKEAMVWKLMAILPGLLEREEFAPLKHYIQDETHAENRQATNNERKCFQLAQQIADLFDQYLVYRPEWINSWERGEDESPAAQRGLVWQPALWRVLLDYAHSLGQSSSHRANLFTDTARQLTETAATMGLNLDLPPRIFVFGISSLAPNYLTVLDALSHHVDVHIMLFNPCMMYWGDVRDQRHQARMHTTWRKHAPIDNYANAESAVNPLLVSMAQQGRDYLDLLHNYETEDIDAFVEVEPVNLLSMIQSDVLHLRHRCAEHARLATSEHSEFKTQITESDDSLQIHSCYSALREVENLHQQLLVLFDQDPSLAPKDIVVMMADVDSYAPYVQAIFANAEGNQYIPWSISDRSVRAEDTIVNSFLWFLQLPMSRLTLLEVVDVLSVPLIATSFGLDEDSIALLRDWLQVSGVRWGLHAEQKQQFDLPEVQQNTWAFGLRRLLLGYAMSDAGTVPGKFAYDGILPVTAVEAMNSHYLGKLIKFLDALDYFRVVLNGSHTIDAWQVLINELLETFYFADSNPQGTPSVVPLRPLSADEEQSLQSIREHLAELRDIVNNSGLEEEISFQVFLDAMKGKLNNLRGSQRFLAGQVNFCTLMPMRSMPFKVVCLLGMNDGVYPRSLQPWGVDLMAGDYRKGDRSRRDDDRYLFLEAILSAREKLIISYQGRSIRDSSEKMPSVLVNELLEYCQQAFVLAGDETISQQKSAVKLRQHLIVEHPLQVFNPVYFSPQLSKKYFSYSENWCHAAKAVTSVEPLNEQQFCSESLSRQESEDYLELSELITCMLNPAKYFLNKRLGVYSPNENAELDIEEPFVLGGLQRYQLKQQLLEHCLHEDIDLQGNVDDLLLLHKNTGVLPVGNIGEQLLRNLLADIAPLWSKLQRLKMIDPEGFKEGFADARVYFDEGNDFSFRLLAGRIAKVNAAGLVHYRPADFKAKDKLRLWLEHLALCASGAGTRPNLSLFVGLDKIFRFSPLDQVTATRYLHDYISHLDAACGKPLAFMPETSWAYVNNLNESVEKQTQAMQRAFFGSVFNKIPGDWDDFYVQTCFSDDVIASEQFRVLAVGILQPLIDHLQALSSDEFVEITERKPNNVTVTG